jgi:hypothetical protein
MRLRSQWIAPATAGPSAVPAVRHLIGVQAQIPSAAALAVRARTTAVRAADVQRDLLPGRLLVRTWLMRGTLHLAAAEDVDWLLTALAPPVLRASHRRHAELGLDAVTLTRSADVLVRLLEDGPATRKALFAGLAERGIDPAGQRGIHMIRHAALRGLLCCGPDHGREQTWVRGGAATSANLSRDEALAALASRYRVAYGPADARDLAAWSGLPASDAQQAWHLAGDVSDELSRLGGRRSTVRLLPHFDPYLLGYADRGHAVGAEHRRTVWTGGGYVLPTVMVDGWAVGTWHSKTTERRVALTVTPFEPGKLGARISAGIAAEVEDIARFFSRDASWSVDPGT